MSPSESMYNGRKAAVSLRFIIVGAGPCGLSTAFALAKAGHECTILEAATEIATTLGAINIPSNLTKIYQEWGIDKEIAKKACRPLGLEYRKYRTGEKFGGVNWNDLMLDATGNDYYLAEYSHVLRILLKLARDNGVKIRLGCKVASVDPDEPSVTLTSGEVIQSDVIVGADGEGSTVRDCILGHHDAGTPRGYGVFVCLIPLEKVSGDPDLDAIATSPQLSDWLGPDRIAFGISMQSAGYYGLFLIHPEDDPNVDDSWTSDDDVERIKKHLAGWDPKLLKLVNLIEHTTDVKQIKREPYDNWIHEDGRVVLVGDAAHPMPAHAVQKLAMAVEDAAVLGNLFSRLQSRDNITFMLQAYQELRQSRCNYVQADEEIKHICQKLREGTDEDLEERDEELREKYLSKDITPEQFEELWEMSTLIFRYEVDLEVDQWWKDFGALMSPHEDRRSSGFIDLGMATTTVTVEAYSSDSEPYTSPTPAAQVNGIVNGLRGF